MLERHAEREFDDDAWQRIALTQAQVNRSPVSAALPSPSRQAQQPPKRYEAIECEAMKQTELVKLVRKWLDSQLPEPLDRVLVTESNSATRSAH